MQRKRRVTLTTLNDDCLLLICAQLSIKDQFALLQLNGTRLKQLVLQIWQRKYASSAFDWQLEPQLKLLSEDEQSLLLGYMSQLTSGLNNLSQGKAVMRWLLHATQGGGDKLTRLRSLSFVSSQRQVLPLIAQICGNLTQLQLGVCVGVSPADVRLLLAALPRLIVFQLLPAATTTTTASCNCNAEWANMEYGQMLQVLQLPACAICATAKEIAQLPQLQQLTCFLCNKASATATISACLAALSAQQEAAAPPRQIVALNLQCQFDACLLRLLQRHLGLLRLQRFAWHSKLLLHFDTADGSIKWLPQRPQVARAVQQFIVSQLASLHELDFTRNVHATPTFLAHLTAQLNCKLKGSAAAPTSPLTIWHDGCPNAATDQLETAKDLHYVELQLQQLTLDQQLF